MSVEAEDVRALREHLLSEIRRCDVAIEGGDSDPWWREDRDRLKRRLDDLDAPAKAAPKPTQPSIGLDERERIARALIEALDGKPLTDGMWAEALKSHRQLESEFGDQWLKSRSMTADAFRQADAILALWLGEG